jgi:pyrophosphate--fructose-6-phosphate 1-phosphotransferase
MFRAGVVEATATPPMPIGHEVMDHHCGWLAVCPALDSWKILWAKGFMANIGPSRENCDIQGVYLPELTADIENDAATLRGIPETAGNVSIFVSEDACIQEIVESMRQNDEEKPLTPSDTFSSMM